MRKYIYSTLIVLGFATAANAQTSGGVRTASQTATVVLEQVLDVTIKSSTLTDFTFNSVSDYDNGIVQSGATTFDVNASVPWKIYFKADNTQFNVTAGTSTTPMPLSVFSIGKTGDALQTLTDVDSANPLSIGGRGSKAVTGNSFTVDYKANPGYNYDPATYSVGVIYTISAQ